MTSLALPQASFPRPASRYESYAYTYPHKTAYRHIDPGVPLAEVWAGESRDALFLYVHIPFCEMRCGFCNLFTLAQPQDQLVTVYLEQLQVEAQRTAAALGRSHFARMAIGGGTPTYLENADLQRLFELLERTFALSYGRIPISVETSPRTATSDKMQLLKRFGVTRVSMGVQSFIESEVAASGRAQKNEQVASAIRNIRAAEIPLLNLDLIYGLPGQTVASWIMSVRAALTYQPEEIYLYPLYVRPLTGLGRREGLAHDVREECYRAACEVLETAGYQQVSMRMFRRHDAAEADGPSYCCQDDGMIGIGCGARSYTRALHYSREFAVGREGVKSILHDYIRRPAAAFDVVDYGCRLDLHEQQRRYVIKSVLRREGLSRHDYRDRFGTEVLDDIPMLLDFLAEGFLISEADWLRPTQKGLDYSDYMGPRLYSMEMKRRMEAFDLR